MSGKRDSKEAKEHVDKADFQALQEKVADNMVRLETQLNAKIEESHATLTVSINDHFRMLTDMILNPGLKKKLQMTRRLRIGSLQKKKMLF